MSNEVELAKPEAFYLGKWLFSPEDIAAERERGYALYRGVLEKAAKLEAEACCLSIARTQQKNRAEKAEARIAELEKELARIKNPDSCKWSWENGMSVTKKELRKDV